jgi:hypothetical protein
VLESIQDHPVSRINELMPLEYQPVIEIQKVQAEAKMAPD